MVAANDVRGETTPMTPDEVEDIIRHLAAAIEHQRSINTDLRQFVAQQTGINERLTGAIERLDVTVQGIKDLLGRNNGH